MKKRYEDERAIRKRHIQCLFEMPQVQRESAVAIQNLVDHVQKHLRILHSMNLPTESWGELIVYLIEKHLDKATRGRWEEHVVDKEVTTTNVMIDFLQRRCQVLERASLSGNKDNAKRSGCKNHIDGNKQRQAVISNSNSKTTLSTTVQSGRCYLCQGQHLIYSCKQFLSAGERMREAKRLRLHINCLRSDHFVKDCRSSSRMWRQTQYVVTSQAV